MRTLRKNLILAAMATLPILVAACGGNGNVERAAEQVQERVQALLQDPIREAGLTAVADLPDPPEGQVTIQLRWRYQGEPLPGEGLVPYETVPETDGLFAMESLEAGQPVPRGDRIEDGIMFVKPGEEIHVEWVYENPTDQDITFVALAWYVEPYTVKPFTYPSCLCLSIPYTAPANGAWYRTIYYRLDPAVEPGTKMAITWTAVTDPAQFALLPDEVRPGEEAPPAEPTEKPTERPTEAPAASPKAAVTLDIVGRNIQFDKGRLEVAPNTPFVVRFDNQDNDIPHNFAIYRTAAARDLIAATEIEDGPVVQELAVAGLEPGEYFYRCDVHPATMTGVLKVE